jgi:RNA polymerase sigma-70 factor (ECF subfamily)
MADVGFPTVRLDAAACAGQSLRTRGRGVNREGVANSSLQSSFEEFFAQTTPGLIGQVYLLTSDLADAQDIVQETMLRAWRDWSRVSTYDHPEAWARRVAHNLAVTRWRRIRVGQRRAASERPAPLGQPDAEYLDLVAALAKLPPRQRRALVLFEVVGLSGDEIAAELSVPSGTVRGWLTRARRFLAAELSVDDAPSDQEGRHPK